MIWLSATLALQGLMPVLYILADTAVQRGNIIMKRGLLRVIDET